MARSPVLVWRNVTRIRLIHAFRAAFDAPEDELLEGEPLICDGIELPLKHRKKRLDLEARGLIKGAQVIYLGPGATPGFSRLHVIGAEDPQVGAACIIKIEHEGDDEPFIPFAARMGATFVHGAAVTIHKAQGSAMGHGAGLCARHLCRQPHGSGRGGAALVETPGLCCDHARRARLALGRAQPPGAPLRAADGRGSDARGRPRCSCRSEGAMKTADRHRSLGRHRAGGGRKVAGRRLAGRADGTARRQVAGDGGTASGRHGAGRRCDRCRLRSRRPSPVLPRASPAGPAVQQCRHLQLRPHRSTRSTGRGLECRRWRST